MQEMKDKIESLQQELQEVESSYKFQVDRIDSQLGKIKDSLLETLSLLQPPPRKTLQKRFAEYFSFPTEWLRTNGKTILFYFVIIPILFCGMYLFLQKDFRQPIPDKTSPPALLTMTQTEYNLLRSAEGLVNKDIDKFNSIGDAISAFYAESPMSVRDAVIDRLGSVGSLEDLPKELENILGRVVVKKESEVRSQESEEESNSDILTPHSSLLTPPLSGGSVEGFLRVSPSIIENSSAANEDEPDQPGLVEKSENGEPPTVSPEKTEKDLAGTPATEKTEYRRQRTFRRR